MIKIGSLWVPIVGLLHTRQPDRRVGKVQQNITAHSLKLVQYYSTIGHSTQFKTSTGSPFFAKILPLWAAGHSRTKIGRVLYTACSIKYRVEYTCSTCSTCSIKYIVEYRIAELPGQKVAPASRHNIVGRRIVILVTMMIIMMVKIVMMILVSKSILECFSSRNTD